MAYPLKPRMRISSAITHEEFSRMTDTFLNGGFFQKQEIFVSKISRLTESDIGTHGEQVLLSPFFLSAAVPSFVPSNIESRVTSERSAARAGEGDAFCLPLDADSGSGEQNRHAGLRVLSAVGPAAYVTPLFTTRRGISASVSPDKLSLEESDGKMFHSSFLKQTGLIFPHTDIEAGEKSSLYSFTKRGEIVFHSETATKVKQEIFLLSDLLLSLFDRRNSFHPLIPVTDQLIELLPDILQTPSNTKKYRSMVGRILHEHIDENELPGNSSVHKVLDAFAPRERLVIVEKILMRYLGISPYFACIFRNR